MEGIEIDLCLHNVNNTQNVICCLHQKKKKRIKGVLVRNGSRQTNWLVKCLHMLLYSQWTSFSMFCTCVTNCNTYWGNAMRFHYV